jgi:hypothetical protein
MSFTFRGQTFQTVFAARKVAEGWTLVDVPCGWLVEHREFDGYDVAEWVADCGAELVESARGWACAAGHEHTFAEVRDREGWDYAQDGYDVAVLAHGGKEARPMGPTTHLDPVEAAHAYSTLF